MNKLFSFILIASLLTLGACQQSDSKEEGAPGNIPGMGNAGGELEVEEYELHDDLVLGGITGIGSNGLAASLKSAEEIIITGSAYGSGKQVVVELEMTNTHPDECRSAWFRAGTVFESSLTGVQNAILVSPVNVCIPPATTKKFVMYLYCLNLGQDNPDGDDSYEMLGVTTSEAVLEFIKLLQFKKVNYEHYVAYIEKGFDYSYEEVQAKIQEYLWKITNGDGLEEDDYIFIDNLPALPEGVLPLYIYDLEYTNLPDCWCLDECSEVSNSGALSYIKFVTDCSSVFEDESFYPFVTNDFPFKVEIKDGSVKFEANGEQLGEDAEVEWGIFEFTASCEDSDITVYVKNKETEEITLNFSEVSEGILTSNGFMVEFVEKYFDDVIGRWRYSFLVVSDSCPGSPDK